MAPPPAQFYTPPGCICIGVELLLREYFDYLWQAKREGARSNGAARKKGALVPREQAYHATSLATQSHRAAAPASLQLVSNNVVL